MPKPPSRMSIQAYRAMNERALKSAVSRNKYGNRKTEDGFDSEKERSVFQDLQMRRTAGSLNERVLDIVLQKRFELMPAQPGERPVFYVADFFVTYADGRCQVIDVKSAVTRKIPTYVIKRKLLLLRYGLRILEL